MKKHETQNAEQKAGSIFCVDGRTMERSFWPLAVSYWLL